MAQGAAMRNGTPMRLVSPAPVLVQPQGNRQTPAGASLYSNTPQSLYNANVNTSVNGGTLGGKPSCYFIFLMKYQYSRNRLSARTLPIELKTV